MAVIGADADVEAGVIIQAEVEAEAEAEVGAEVGAEEEAEAALRASSLAERDLTRPAIFSSAAFIFRPKASTSDSNNVFNFMESFRTSSC